MVTVGILGAGNVGLALGARAAAANCAVRFGVRDAAAVRAELPASLAAAIVGAPAEAVREADIVLLAVPAAAAVAVLGAAGDLTGKTVVDATNPLRWEAGPVWNPPHEGSMTAAIAAAFPGVAVVKGFNHFGAEIQADPAMAHGAAEALFAGDHADAKARAITLAQAMGFAARDAGPLRNAAALEHLAVLWIHLATVGGAGRQIAFRIEGRA